MPLTATMATAITKTRNVEIRLLGQAHFAVNGKPFPFSAPPKTLPLLVYLITHRAAPCSRETLAYSLWPDTSEDEARTNLRRHIHRLSKALPDIGVAWIITEGVNVQWNANAPCDADVSTYEKLIGEKRFREAVVLYRGDLAQGINDDIIIADRERLRDLQASALTGLAKGARSANDHVAVIDWATRLLRLDSFREDALRWLIAAKHELADRSGALAEYDHFVRRLQEELGVEPAPETIALHEVVLRQGALGTTSATEINSRREPLPFVGREEQLGTLLRLWEQAARGSGATVLLHGEAGIGKTRLSTELRTRIEAQGGRFIVGGTRYAEPQPFQCAAEALGAALASLLSLDVDPLALSVAASILPEIRVRRPALPDVAKLDSARERGRLFEAVANLFCSISASRPLVVLFEDVHWASPDTIALIEHLARRISTESLLLVVTYREEEMERGDIAGTPLRAILREGLATSVPVARLREADVRALCGQTYSRSAGEAAHLYQLTEGHPLFLAEALQEADSIVSKLPRTIAESVERRLERISPPARNIVECAAVLAQGFDIRILSDICAWPEYEVTDALNELMDCRLVRLGSVRDHTEYVFTHSLIQRAIFSQTDAERRRVHHSRAAHALERSTEKNAAEIARHLEGALLYAQAASMYASAAREALAVAANERAAMLAERGLAHATDADARFALGLEREEALRRLGRRELQRAQIAELETLGDGDPAHYATALLRHIEYALTSVDAGDLEVAVSSLERLANLNHDPTLEAQALLARARASTTLSNPNEAEKLLLRTVETYRALKDRRGEAMALFRLAEIYPLLSRLEEAENALQRSFHIARELDDPFLMQEALAASAVNAHHSLKPALGEERARELLTLTQRTGDREGEARAHQLIATATTATFQLDTAEKHFLIARNIFETLNLPHGRASAIVNLGVTYHLLGRWSEALEAFQTAIDAFGALGDRRRAMSATLNTAVVMTELGNYEGAKEYGTRALQLAQEHAGTNYVSVALTALGVCERENGYAVNAIGQLEKAIELDGSIANPLEPATKLCELILAYVAAERIAEARALADRVRALPDTELAAMGFPQLAGYAAYRAYQAAGCHSEAAVALNSAKFQYAERLSKIPAQWQAAYRTSILNRQIDGAAVDGAPRRPHNKS